MEEEKESKFHPNSHTEANFDRMFMDAFRFEGPDHDRLQKALHHCYVDWMLLGNKILDLYLADLITRQSQIDTVAMYNAVRHSFTEFEAREKCLTLSAFGTFLDNMGQAKPDSFDQCWNFYLRVLALMYRDTTQELCHAFLRETVYPFVLEFFDTDLEGVRPQSSVQMSGEMNPQTEKQKNMPTFEAQNEETRGTAASMDKTDDTLTAEELAELVNEFKDIINGMQHCVQFAVQHSKHTASLDVYGDDD